jgi:hypothetical protein
VALAGAEGEGEGEGEGEPSAREGLAVAPEGVAEGSAGEAVGAGEALPARGALGEAAAEGVGEEAGAEGEGEEDREGLAGGGVGGWDCSDGLALALAGAEGCWLAAAVAVVALVGWRGRAALLKAACAVAVDDDDDSATDCIAVAVPVGGGGLALALPLDDAEACGLHGTARRTASRQERSLIRTGILACGEGKEGRQRVTLVDSRQRAPGRSCNSFQATKRHTQKQNKIVFLLCCVPGS